MTNSLYLKSYHAPNGQWIAVKRRIIAELGLSRKLTKGGSRQNGATVYIDKDGPDMLKLIVAIDQKGYDLIERVKHYDTPHIIGKYAAYTRP